MRNWLFTVMLVTISLCTKAQSSKDQETIYATMNRQMSDWNRGDIDAFMNGYWESDSLMFVGKAGITQGYKATHARYLKSYPDRATMGTLKFTYLSLTFPGNGVAFLVGKFHLTRPEKGNLEGHYSLLWKKINGKWVVICDHTSG
jgi:ketosteroid isomerase-like protein